MSLFDRCIMWNTSPSLSTASNGNVFDFHVIYLNERNSTFTWSRTGRSGEPRSSAASAPRELALALSEPSHLGGKLACWRDGKETHGWLVSLHSFGDGVQRAAPCYGFLRFVFPLAGQAEKTAGFTSFPKAVDCTLAESSWYPSPSFLGVCAMRDTEGAWVQSWDSGWDFPPCCTPREGCSCPPLTTPFSPPSWALRCASNESSYPQHLACRPRCCKQ